MEKQISLIQGDFLKEAESLKTESFDHIISNPPYRKIETGRINPDSGKAVARHELTISMSSLIDKSARLLKKGGQISLAYPTERLSELMRELEYHNLYPRQARFVHGNYQTPAKIVLISARKEKKTDFSVNPPLAVYNKDGTYSKGMKEVYASFNYIDGPNGIGKK
jgi:tRNA1Val (adenine37-N6)-methyltransferase